MPYTRAELTNMLPSISGVFLIARCCAPGCDCRAYGLTKVDIEAEGDVSDALALWCYEHFMAVVKDESIDVSVVLVMQANDDGSN